MTPEVQEHLAELFARVAQLEERAAPLESLQALEKRVIELENALPEDQVSANELFINAEGRVE